LLIRKNNENKKEIIFMIALASDHAGFEFKERAKSLLDILQIGYKDFGTTNTDSCDYPDFGKLAARSIIDEECERGIAICGSGIGMSIVLNRFKGIRATLCLDEEMARVSRSHNNSNILVLADRITPWIVAEKIIKTWLVTEFEGGRHQLRINKIDL
jgi:ribose 5-phosphate isomerase B